MTELQDFACISINSQGFHFNVTEVNILHITNNVETESIYGFCLKEKFNDSERSSVKFVSERNRYVSNCEMYRCKMKRHDERSAFLVNSGSSVLLQFSLVPIYHSWKFSKEFCPSTEYHSLSMQLSNSMLKFHSFTENPSSCKYLRKSKDLFKAVFCSQNIRNYSSCKKPPCNKNQFKSDDCDKTTTTANDHQQDVSNDSKFDEDMKGCSQPSRKCQLPIEDIFDEYTPPCSDIEDYCPEGKVFYKKISKNNKKKKKQKR